MSKPKPSSFSWQKALAFITKCPLCGTVYNAKEATLCSEEQKAYLVHLTCRGCASFFVVMIVMVGQSASSVGMITDLSSDDIRRLYKSSPISLNEAINGYKIMESKRFHQVFFNNISNK